MKRLLVVLVSFVCLVAVMAGCQQLSEDRFYSRVGDAGLATSDMAIPKELSDKGITKYDVAMKDSCYSIEYYEFSSDNEAEAYYNGITKKYNELFDEDCSDVYVNGHNEYTLDNEMFYIKGYREGNKLTVLSVQDLSYKNTSLKIFNDIIVK